MISLQSAYLLALLLPLLAATINGFGAMKLPRTLAHWVGCSLVAISCALSVWIWWQHALGGVETFNQNLYTWFQFGNTHLSVGLLIDNLTSLMMVVVTSISLMVHIYTIGYMSEDKGYVRFFSYLSLFTFAMLSLVMSNNFLQLFFGWEAVGLVSYLLIGFWHHKPTAIFANMKAFLMNRVGDFGFLLGIAAIYGMFGTLDYAEVFAQLDGLVSQNFDWGFIEFSAINFACIALFVGAMGKSAQMPLHAWLPDSMEGPTPISALIHAATMVTAGIFMVARLSPIYELSPMALNTILVIGALTAFLMGLLGLIQNDIKRIVAYSTLSQLGYMTMALGVSAYSVAIFHLFTHAFFKALLFLAAGSVIVAMHHEQNLTKMGGLFKKMPITALTMLLGSLALIGFPGFSGFFSKDLIIEAIGHSHSPLAFYVYLIALAGVMITALYSVRLFYLVFLGKTRASQKAYDHAHESPLVITIPLCLLALPSVFIGYVLVDWVVFGDYFLQSLAIDSKDSIWHEWQQNAINAIALLKHSVYTPAFWLMLSGVVIGLLSYTSFPNLPQKTSQLFAPLIKLMEVKYGFDLFYEKVSPQVGVKLGKWFSKYSDQKLIDGYLVNGTARLVGSFANKFRFLQSGNIANYAFIFTIVLTLCVAWVLLSDHLPLKLS